MKLITSCIAATLLATSLSQADCSDNTSHFLPYSDDVVAVRDHFFTSMCGAGKGELYDFLDPSLKGRIVAPKKMHSTHKGDYYPDSARRQHHEGTTIAAYVVGIDGNVSDVSVIKSSGYAELDQAAVSAINSMHFEQPAELDGNAVRVILYFPFKWHLT